MDHYYEQKQKAAYAQQATTANTLRGNSLDAPCESPCEPGLLGKAHETLGYLRELESIHSAIRTTLYGSFPECSESTAKNNPNEPSLQELLSWICVHTAMAVGEARNLLARME